MIDPSAPPDAWPDPWAGDAPRPARRATEHLVRWGPVLAVVMAGGVVAQAWRYGGGAPVLLVRLGLIVVAAELVVRAGRRRWSWAPVRLVGLVALAALGARSIGPTPAVLLVVSVALADAALVSWQPLRSWPQRGRVAAPLAVGALLAAQVTWYRTQSRPLTAVLLIATVALLEFYARAPAAATRAEHGLESGAKRAVSALVWVVLLLICLVVVYLPGAIVRAGRWVLRRWRGQPESTWQHSGSTAVGDRRDSIRPFAATPIEARRRTVRIGAVALAVAMLAGFVVWRDRRQPVTPADPLAAAILEAEAHRPSTTTTTPRPGSRQILATEGSIRYSELPAYRGVDWADDLQQEEQGPIIDGHASGRYRNIRNSYRVTTPAPACPDCKRVRVWLSGGSAAFGIGQRDQRTIASDLVRLAYERDRLVLDLANLSHAGYTFQMEWEWEIQPALRTEDPPDLLVFFHGWNDAGAELIADYLHGPDPDRKLSVLLPTDLAQVNAESERFMASDIGPAAGSAAATRYLRIQRQVEDAARESGVETAYFFQPDALASLRQVSDYEQITGFSGREMVDSPIAQCLEAMTAALADDPEGRRVVDLRHLFDDTDEPVFLGLVHQNETGARRVAEAIYDDLRSKLMAQAR